MNLHSSSVRIWWFEAAYWTLLGAALMALVVGLASGSWFWSAFGLMSSGVWLYAGFVEPRCMLTTIYRMRLSPDGGQAARLVFLSDLHAGAYKGPSYYKKMVKKTNALRPDVIMLGGDMVEERVEALRDLVCLKQLRATQGIFFLLGNHDFEDQPEMVAHALRAWGFHDLTNRRVALACGSDAVCELAGLDDAWRGSPTPSLVREAKTRPRIVVTHEPDGLLDIDAGQADLVLTGHTHGGQVRLPWVGALSPLPQLVPASFDRGLKHWKGIPIIISQGLGEATSRLRFFCPPQIVVVDVVV